MGTFLPFILVGIVVIMIFVIIAIPVASVFDDTISELSKDDAFGTSERSNESMQQVKGLVTPAFDQLIFIVLLAIIIGILLIGIFSDFSPALVSVLIIAIVFFVIIAGVFGEFFEDYSSNSEISGKANEFKLTNVVMGSQFPIIILIVGVISIIMVLAKRGRVISPV